THPSATEPLRVPFDLHVLATPPAFRLSQDQTLQLNFLARVIPDALCGPCGLRETDTFMARVYPRNEFGPNHPVLDKPAGWLLPPMRLGIEGQSSHFTR